MLIGCMVKDLQQISMEMTMNDSLEGVPFAHGNRTANLLKREIILRNF